MFKERDPLDRSGSYEGGGVIRKLGGGTFQRPDFGGNICLMLPRLALLRGKSAKLSNIRMRFEELFSWRHEKKSRAMKKTYGEQARN